MAASCTITLEPMYDSNTNKDKFKLTFAWTSAADGSVSAATSAGTYMGRPIDDIIKGKVLDMGKVIPGATTPTADFDVAVTDEDSFSVFSTAFTDCSATATTSAYPYDATNYGTRYITGTLTVAVTNAGDSKTGSVVLHIS